MFELKTIDKYLIKKYLSTFFFTVMIFILISVSIDFSDKVQSFIEKPCTIKEIIVDYFLGFIFYITGLLFPMFTLIAVVFFTSRLAFNAEILSILNAGVSFNRLLKPYLIAASTVFLLHLYLNHYIIPKFNKSRLWFEHTYVWTDQDKGKTNNVHFLLTPDTKAFIRGYNKNNKVINGLRIEQFVNNKVVSILDAETATWKEDRQKWELGVHTVHTFDGVRERLVKNALSKDTLINLTPQDFVYYHNQNEEMTTGELYAALDRDRNRGVSNSKIYEIEIYRRTADAFTNIILAIMGLAVAGRKVRGGMGLHLAVGIGIGAAFVLLSKFAISFASNSAFPVIFALWIPNIIFSLLCIWLVSRAQK